MSNKRRVDPGLQKHLLTLRDFALSRESFHRARFLASGDRRDVALALRHCRIRLALEQRITCDG